MPDAPLKSDPELRDLLQTWQVVPRDDSALARRVWAQLEREKPRGLAAWFEQVSVLLSRPIAIVAAIVVFAAIGGLAAEVQQAREREAQITRLASDYAHSIDPILMTHPDHDAGHRP